MIRVIKSWQASIKPQLMLAEFDFVGEINLFTNGVLLEDETKEEIKSPML
jgi:hypothetical protein